jgi:hypothetical protein
LVLPELLYSSPFSCWFPLTFHHSFRCYYWFLLSSLYSSFPYLFYLSFFSLLLLIIYSLQASLNHSVYCYWFSVSTSNSLFLFDPSQLSLHSSFFLMFRPYPSASKTYYALIAHYACRMLLVGFLPYSSTLKMEVVCTFETSVYRTQSSCLHVLRDMLPIRRTIETKGF